MCQPQHTHVSTSFLPHMLKSWKQYNRMKTAHTNTHVTAHQREEKDCKMQIGKMPTYLRFRTFNWFLVENGAGTSVFWNQKAPFSWAKKSKPLSIKKPNLAWKTIVYVRRSIWSVDCECVMVSRHKENLSQHFLHNPKSIWLDCFDFKNCCLESKNVNATRLLSM